MVTVMALMPITTSVSLLDFLEWVSKPGDSGQNLLLEKCFIQNDRDRCSVQCDKEYGGHNMHSRF